MKVGTPVYESAYVGKALAYARPSQYPSPLVCGGMLSGAPGTRFSDSSHSTFIKGNSPNLGLRLNDGWVQPATYPWSNSFIAGPGSSRNNGSLRDTDGAYPIIPVELTTSAGVHAAMDGVCYISGFDNVVENTMTIGGIEYIIIQDVWRTGHRDYFAIRMDG